MSTRLSLRLAGLGLAALVPLSAAGASTASIAAAVRMSGALTGGSMPPSAPEFTQMVSAIDAGDYNGAAMAAVNSAYFARTLVRRMALEMQNPTFTTVHVADSAATALIMANLIGSATTPSISSLWSDNHTYLVQVTRNGAPTNVDIASLTAAELAAADFRTDFVQVAGQQAVTDANLTTMFTIPAKHVGGYFTLSSSKADGSYASFAFTAGTNIRAVEGLYEISMGLTLNDMMSAVNATAPLAPRFVPSNDPNFLTSQVQPACILCHGGGVSDLVHGYSAVADLFDFDPAKSGLIFQTKFTNTTEMKSLGSDAGNRAKVLACNSKTFTTCNPQSMGADPNQAWDVTVSWEKSGLLQKMGWNGPTAGQGLNALGAALGKATLVYSFLLQRVIGEICPTGAIPEADQSAIVSETMKSDNFKTLVAAVASHPSCR